MKTQLTLALVVIAALFAGSMLGSRAKAGGSPERWPFQGGFVCFTTDQGGISCVKAY